MVTATPVLSPEQMICPLKSFPLLIAVSVVSASLLAQSAAPAAGDANANPPDATDAGGRARRSNSSPEAMMAALRDRFGVTDDAEWSLISTRITAVIELRRSVGGFGGLRAGGDSGRAIRQGGANPEMDALRTAVTDKLPDAEIKARLDRFREVRKRNEAKLDKAREDLRAVLTVRQEALAVLMGLLT